MVTRLGNAALSVAAAIFKARATLIELAGLCLLVAGVAHVNLWAGYITAGVALVLKAGEIDRRSR